VSKKKKGQSIVASSAKKRHILRCRWGNRKRTVEPVRGKKEAGGAAHKRRGGEFRKVISYPAKEKGRRRCFICKERKRGYRRSLLKSTTERKKTKAQPSQEEKIVLFRV